jgi:hypothetical protein
MRRIYWSIPALLLAGAVVWAQQPASDPVNPTRGEPKTLPPQSNLNIIRFDSPNTVSSQTFPAATRTIRRDLDGNVVYDSGVIPPGRAGMMESADSMYGMMTGGTPSGPMKAKQVQRMFVETQYVPLTDFEIREKQSFEEALRALQSDDPKADKTAALKAVHELLSVGFERDLETRESELKQLETRVQKLRAQLDKRKAAKQEIIDLRLKTIQNEADGLEYPGAATQPAGTPILREPGAPADGT